MSSGGGAVISRHTTMVDGRWNSRCGVAGRVRREGGRCCICPNGGRGVWSSLW